MNELIKCIYQIINCMVKLLEISWDNQKNWKTIAKLNIAEYCQTIFYLYKPIIKINSFVIVFKLSILVLKLSVYEVGQL